MTQLVKNLPAVWETWVRSLGWEDPMERGKAAVAKSLQLCPTLCDPMDGSLPGSSVPGILQARLLEWVAISFSKGKATCSNMPGEFHGLYSPRGHKESDTTEWFSLTTFLVFLDNLVSPFMKGYHRYFL